MKCHQQGRTSSPSGPKVMGGQNSHADHGRGEKGKISVTKSKEIREDIGNERLPKENLDIVARKHTIEVKITNIWGEEQNIVLKEPVTDLKQQGPPAREHPEE